MAAFALRFDARGATRRRVAAIVAAVRVSGARFAATGIVRALVPPALVRQRELLLEDDLRAPDLRVPPEDLRVADFFEADLRAPPDFFEADFLDVDLRAPDDFFEGDFRPPDDFVAVDFRPPKDFFDAVLRAPDFFVALFFFAPPPVSLFTVAQARLSAVFFDTPRFS